MEEARKELIKEIVIGGSIEDRIHLYRFNGKTSHELIADKFFIFARANFSRFFMSKGADMHRKMVEGLVESYYSGNYGIMAFRGAAKTALKKLFDVFVLLNDSDNRRRFIKVLCKDFKNSKQIVTDVFNLIVELEWLYGNVFDLEKGDRRKREETMSGFTLSSGRKYVAGTIGQTQRGHIQDAYRPDWLWFDDVEDRESIHSSSTTYANIGRMAEAIDGLSIDGSFVVTGNYISDQGAVQWFMNKPSVRMDIFPIMDEVGNPTWGDRYTKEVVARLMRDSDDPFGEYMCDPQRSTNKFFDIEQVEADILKVREPIKQSSGFRYWANYEPHHRYGAGSDHSDGIGKDSNAYCLFDFTTGELVVSYANNKISPDLSAHEFARVGGEYGNCIYAPEINNKCGGVVITTLKGLGYPKLFRQVSEDRNRELMSDKIGWETTSKTKRTMFFEFRLAYKGGNIKIYDIAVLKEMKAYSNSNLQDENIGLTTKHFDLLMAVVIAWQMEKVADLADYKEKYSKAWENYING